MKRAILYCLVFILLICMLAACNRPAKMNGANEFAYTNTNYHFSLMIPKAWEGKYEISEESNRVVFSNPSNKSAGGRLFVIDVWTKSKWMEEGEALIKLIHITKVGEADDAVFTFSTPTDVQYSLEDEKRKSEYLQLSKDVEAIKSSFKLN
ncbi:methyltransferase [Paenibacillus whitsoniae]|uniref:Methyltransferase n=1 Tax=Paenibacillus whitsoniae TaxID=2496558 RepID=A0A430J817_9BACL|nr:methyltransferase [Paenibacillus whitsoniae]RTE05819.1 methyltransferase [Paenibacillus whitsoniae]